MNKVIRRELTINDFLETGLSRDIAHFALWWHRNLRSVTKMYSWNTMDDIIINKMYERNESGLVRRSTLNDTDWKQLCQIQESILRLYDR